MAADRRSKRLTGLGFGLLIVLAAGLRFYRLGEQSLWLDEAYTWLFTQVPWANFLPGLRIDGVHPPLYYFLVRVISYGIGVSRFDLRLLSAVADLASVLLAGRLGWKIAGNAGAFAAAGFWALNPFMIWYSQDARPYALSAFFALAALVIFIDYTAQTGWRTRILAFLALTLGMMTHFFVFLAAGGLICLAGLQIRRAPRLFREWTLISILAMIPMGLWLVWFFMLPEPKVAIAWIRTPTPLDLPLTLWNMVSGYGGVFSIPSLIFGLAVMVFLLVGVLVGKSALRNLSIVLACVLLPILAAWVLSFRRPVYVDRYFIVLMPFLLPGISSGVERIYRYLASSSPRWTALAATVVLLAIGILNAWQIQTDPKYQREDWQSVSRYLSQNAAGDQAIWLMYSEIILPLEYHYPVDSSIVEGGNPPVCQTPCWYILRQPYTSTHAFSLSVSDRQRPWKPDPPAGCTILDELDQGTGVVVWKVDCP